MDICNRKYKTSRGTRLSGRIRSSNCVEFFIHRWEYEHNEMTKYFTVGLCKANDVLIIFYPTAVFKEQPLKDQNLLMR
jgi:hypothetical protein